MTSAYDIKPAFQRVLRPLCRSLHSAGVTPNPLTIGTLTASLGMGLWLFVARDPVIPLLVLPVFLVVRMAANALDGMIAKEYGLSSRTGAMLNEVGDVIADAALYLPFATLPGIRSILPVAIVTLGVTTEVAGLAAASVGGRRRYDGPMGKSDRALAFGLLAIAYASGLRGRLFLDCFMWTVIILLLATIVNRCRHVGREVA